MILTLSGILVGLFLIFGFLVWLFRFLIRRRVGLVKVLKWTGACYLVTLPLLVLVVLPLLSAWMIAHSGTRPQDLRLEIDPATFGCAFETLSFDSRDGVKLEGWWLPGAEDKPTVLISHGLFRDRKEVVERACRLNQLGYATLAYDLRRHGASGGDAVSLGFQERLDVLGAYDQARRLGRTSIVLMGVSMGATATLLALPELDGQVRAIIADSPFASLEETVGRHVWLFLGLPSFPFVPIFDAYLGHLAGFSPEQLNAVKAVSGDLATPVLLLYGADDQRMPQATADQIFRAISVTSKEKVVFPGAKHAGAWKTDPSRYMAVIQNFIDGVTPQPAPAGPEG